MAAAALTKSIAVSTLTRNNALPFIKGNAMSYQSPGAASGRASGTRLAPALNPFSKPNENVA